MFNNFLAWLAAIGPAVAISESSWLFPGIEVARVPPSSDVRPAFDRAAPEPKAQQR
jgi:hypothetical protein